MGTFKTDGFTKPASIHIFRGDCKRKPEARRIVAPKHLFVRIRSRL